MKAMRLLAGLFIIGFLFSCSGSGGGPGGGGTRQGQNVVLSSDQLISHFAGSPTVSEASDQSQPAVAYDANGQYLVVWTNSSKVNSTTCGPSGTSVCGTDIQGAVCTGSASSLSCGDPFFISSDITTPANQPAGNQSQPKVAFYNNGASSEYLVVWTDSRNGYSQIYGQFVTTSATTGTMVGNNFTISPNGASLSGTNITGAPATITYHSLNQSDPDIIFDTVKNRFVVAWLDINSYDPQQIYTWHGTNCSNISLYSYAALPYSDNNQIESVEVVPITNVVDLTTLRHASTIVFSSGFTEATAGSLTATFFTQKNESKPKITFSPVTGDYFTSWSGMNHTITFSATYIADATTCFIIPPATSCTCSPSNPCVCAYSAATITDTDNDKTPRIKIRKNTGLGLVQDFSFGTVATAPALATDPNTNRVLVSWEENTGGATGIDILGQLVDLSNFVNFGSQINITTATGDQTSPAASFDPTNQRFFVVWEDARNQSANISNIDIYGQFIDPQGNLSGGNLPVTTAQGNQLAPALAFGDVNFTDFLVAWADGRNPGNSDIFGQLLQFSIAPQLLIKAADPTTFNPATFDPNNPGAVTYVDLLNGSINFGNINVGSAGNYPFQLCNNGNAQLTILPLNSVQTPTIPDLPYSFTVPSPVTISPGTCYGMNVKFTPSGAGSYSGNPTNNFKTIINSDGGQVTLFFSGIGIGIQPLSITTTSLLPASIGTLYSSALSAFGGVFPYTWSLDTSTLGVFGCTGGFPISSTVNTGLCMSTGGVISGIANAGTSGTYNFTARVTDNNTPAKTITSNLSITITAVTVTTSTLASWTQGVNYSNAAQQLSATGGTGTPPHTGYTWTISGGPSWLACSASGVLSGTPTSSGVFSFTANVKDSANNPGSAVLSLTINPKPAILTTSLPASVVGSSYNQTIIMSGGTAPLVWSVAPSGTTSLPPGISLNSGTGVISGTLTASQTTPYAFIVTVTDATGTSDTKTLSILVNSPVNITTATAAAATVGTAYTQTFAATGGNLPYTWGIVAGVPPDGLNLDVNTGILSGTPTAAGTFSFAVQVTDSSTPTPVIASKVFSITVAAAPPPPGALSITTTGLTPWTAGIGGYGVQLTATGGQSPYSWSFTGAPLPAGLTLSSSGLLSGTPTTAGTSAIALKVTDAKGTSVTGTFNLTINGPLSITTTALVSGTPGLSYSQQLVLSGGTAPYSWSVSNGTLPNGLSLDPIVGTIQGTPTTAGTSNFTVMVRDAAGAVFSSPFSIKISSGLIIATTSLPDTFLNSSYSQTLLASGGRVPYTWSITEGALPTGLTLDTNTGIISGTPTTLGTFNFTVQVVDADGRIAAQTFSISVLSLSDIIITTNGSETVPQAKIKILKASDLPPLPNSFIMTRAVQYEIDGVTPGGQVLVSVIFSNLSTSPVFYNFRSDTGLVQLANCSSASATDCIDSLDATNKKVVLRIQDNGGLDADFTAGVINDTLVAGYVSSGGGSGVSNSSGGGGCSIGRKQSGPTQVADALVMLAPLFAIILLKNRRRKKK